MKDSDYKGVTKSGKPYDIRRPITHKDYDDFSAEDHKEVAAKHHNVVGRNDVNGEQSAYHGAQNTLHTQKSKEMKQNALKEGIKTKIPEKGTPEWHKLQIAKKTVNMNPEMVGVMGGQSVEDAKKILAKYGLTESDDDINKVYMARTSTGKDVIIINMSGYTAPDDNREIKSFTIKYPDGHIENRNEEQLHFYKDLQDPTKHGFNKSMVNGFKDYTSQLTSESKLNQFKTILNESIYQTLKEEFETTSEDVKAIKTVDKSLKKIGSLASIQQKKLQELETKKQTALAGYKKSKDNPSENKKYISELKDINKEISEVKAELMTTVATLDGIISNQAYAMDLNVKIKKSIGDEYEEEEEKWHD
ncbi:MAG: hypothetical protein M0R17_10605 [Candidatus Omnitrophica bacterium]|jgi:hypothetical protein|nr:hypothetical protein [Candidatus Omnitrophota bacterium]